MNLKIISAASILVLACQTAWSQQIFLDTFGSSATRITSPNVPTTSGAAGANNYYQFATPTATAAGSSQALILDGTYAVVNPQNIRDVTVGGTQAGSWWNVGAPTVPAQATLEQYKNYRDHTGDNGAVLVVNAGGVTSDIYRFPITLEPNTTYQYSGWILVDQISTLTHVSIRDGNDTTEFATSPYFPITTQVYNTPGVASSGAAWREQTYKFTTPPSGGAGACPSTSSFQYSIAYVNTNTATSGNDLFLDDISITKVAFDASADVIGCSTSQLPVVTTSPDNSYTNQGISSSPTFVLNNDRVDISGLLLQLTANAIATPPSNGTVAVNSANGSITYTPAAGFTGTDTYVYRACTIANTIYPNPVCKTETVTVYVLGVTAVDDTANAVAGGPAVPISVMDNDRSSESSVPLDPITLAPPATGVFAPSKGGVVFSNGIANYTPTAGAVGLDTFNYQICTATNSAPYPAQSCAVATVTVTITPIITPLPDTGTATSGTASTAIPNVATGDMVNGQPATLGATGNATVTPVGNWPQGITLNPATGAVNVPATAQPGTYTMDYSLCDKSTPPNCATTTVTITVSNIPTPTPVPTLNPWALAVLSLLLLAFRSLYRTRMHR